MEKGCLQFVLVCESNTLPGECKNTFPGGVYKLFSQGGECIKEEQTELKLVIWKRVVCTGRCSPENLMLCVCQPV